jgi:cobalt-zinc-cadmium efflux system outer membrane protein
MLAWKFLPATLFSATGSMLLLWNMPSCCGQSWPELFKQPSTTASVPSQLSSWPSHLPADAVRPAPLMDSGATPAEAKNLSDEAAPLTLQQLEQMALAGNPSLARAADEVASARGQCLQAGLPPNPRLGYSGQQLGSGGQAEQQGVYLEQEFIRGGKRRLDRAVASRIVQEAEQRFEIQQRRVLTDVRIGYYHVLGAQARLEMSEALVRIGNQAADAAERLLERKEGSRRDLLQARVDRDAAANYLDQARNQLAAAWRGLAAVLGSTEMAPRPLAGQLEELPPLLSWEEAVGGLLAESPERSVAALQVEQTRCEVARAQAQAVPDVNLQAVIQHDNATGARNGSLLVTLPLPIFDRNQGQIRQTRHQLAAAQHAANAVDLDLHQRLAPVYERYVTHRQRVENYQRGILRDAQESLDLTRQGYEAGELDFLNLLTAQRTYFQTNLDYIDALSRMWIAVAEIDGLLLSGSLSSSNDPRDGSH